VLQQPTGRSAGICRRRSSRLTSDRASAAMRELTQGVGLPCMRTARLQGRPRALAAGAAHLQASAQGGAGRARAREQLCQRGEQRLGGRRPNPMP